MASSLPVERDALIADLRSTALELRETHISWVFLHADRVFKVKKPVALGFLDFSTLELRKRACQAELTLNRRLAPRVYLGLRPVTRGDDGTFRIDGEGSVVDWAVEMLRLPDANNAETRLHGGRLGVGDIDRIASAIADFHSRMPTGPDIRPFGEVETIGINVEENFAQTRDVAPTIVSAESLASTQTNQRSFLADHAALFAARVTEGKIRDGHGDLRLEHVYLDESGGLDVIDCIEFSDRLRYADVCADLAFLSMDLRRHGRTDLAERLLADYARAANDFDLYRLVDFYESYRAYVRGKIAAITAGQLEAASAARAAGLESARHYFDLAGACMQQGGARRATLLAVGGIIASGKSTVASAVAERIAAPVVDADRTRKYLAGVAPTQPLGGAPFAGAYSPEASERTYAEVFARADAVLSSGRSVVLDASFREARQRLAVFELADKHGVPALFVECKVDPDTCRQRLERRAQATHVSDGRVAILDDFVRNFEAVREVPDDAHLVIDTASPVHNNVNRVIEAMNSRETGKRSG